MKLKEYLVRPTLFKTIAILCPIFFVLGMIIGHLVEPFRGTWIYQYGSLISLTFSIGVLPISILNSIFIIFEQAELKNRYLWIIVGFLPFIYFLVIYFS